MVFAYIIMNIFYIAFSIKFYRTKINPISIYSILWTIMVVLYELKLVYYYDLTINTWLVIILFQLAYNFGCMLGKTKRSSKAGNDKLLYSSDNDNKDERDLRWTIIIFSLISLISTVSNLAIAIKLYGINLLNYTNQLYIDRLTGNIEESIPYIGVFVFIALIFAGIYIKKYGFRIFILLPIILICLSSLKSGGKVSFAIGFFLVLFPIVFKKDYRLKNIIQDIRVRSNRIQKLKIFIGLSIFIVFFILITINRSQGVTYNSYMSPFMMKMVKYSPTFYKIFVYITGPLGVLNEFLKDTAFNFGGHSFLTIYNFLNKFGADIPVNTYQTFYTVPIKINVGTYIRELIEDFKIILALMVTFITGVVFSYNYVKIRIQDSYINVIWASTLAYVIFMSFFMWSFRSSTFWIILIVGSISGYILDRRRIIRLKNEVSR